MSTTLDAAVHATPVAMAVEHARLRSAELPVDVRKDLGQYFTPVEIAEFMAGLCSVRKPEITILDPGAGTGILSAALSVELAQRESPPRAVRLVLYEVDGSLCGALRNVCDETLKLLEEKGIGFNYDIRQTDFILDVAGNGADHVRPTYDVIITNPPYFKIGKDDPRARVLTDVCHGQPNIYGLFLALSAEILSPDGQLISITPRSFASGDYFRGVRRALVRSVIPDRFHLFETRSRAFRADSVLQENVIARFSAIASVANTQQVAITCSTGLDDLTQQSAVLVGLSDIVDLSSNALTMVLPTSERERRLLKRMRRHDHTLQSLGCQINTGRIVAFRCKGFLRTEPSGNAAHVPMLWLHNVRPMEVVWPAGNGAKPQHVLAVDASRKLLLERGNYVLVRRFSAKEDRARIVAAPLTDDAFEDDLVGIENHLNVIVLPDGRASQAACNELAEYLNSADVDMYFRISNGNTQINASELKALPVPRLRHLG